MAAYPEIPSLSLLTRQNQALYEIDRGFRAPYMMQTAVGIERSLPGRTTLSFNYIDTRGAHVQRLRDINAFLPGTWTGPGTGTRPCPVNDDIYLYESSGLFKQVQFITNVNTRLNSHVSIQGYYVYGQAHSNASGFPMNQYDDNADWGRSSFEARHRVFLGGPAQFSINFRLSRTWGWGEPTNSTNPRPGGSGGGGGGGGRGGGGGGGRGQGGGGGFSNAGRGFTLMVSACNAFNHVNYGPPNGVLTAPFFGESTTLSTGNLPGGGGGGGTAFGGVGSAAGNRRIEIQLRFQF